MIFGLLMTVGISSFALANGDNKEELIEDMVSACYTQHVVIVENSCGVLTGFEIGTPKPVTCGTGEQPGSTKTTYSTKIVFAESCTG